MALTQNLAMPLIAAAQAQKHITHNEALLQLDALLHLSVASTTLAQPPAQVGEGTCYLVPDGALGAFAGHSGEIAHYRDGGFVFYAPNTGWIAWAQDLQKALVFYEGAWQSLSSGGDSGSGSGALPDFSKQNSTVVSGTAHGAASSMVTVEEELVLSDSSVASSVVIPARAIVFCVSVRTTQQIEGASAFDCGIAGEPSKFGGSLSKWLGGSNAGVIGPTAFYSDTPVVLTAKGGAFTSGKVRLALHYFLPTVPQS
ncbi:DUF2793 domain-containing protein [Polycladidibacter stylochi]|uniref:DUF2793 domain-containing protein n=1 Tax=Polycladidibacter stylochi TaxID=1807766 RepID=UPI00082D421B|nr:DUF2793 domain-containing protein [Pseudovibrio stylochi]